MKNRIVYKQGNLNDLNNCLSFIKKFYPKSGWKKKYIIWEYIQNPFGKAKIFLALNNKKIVGITISIPIHFKCNQIKLKGYRTQHVLTDINFRGQGIFSNLLLNNNKYLDDHTDLNITFPNENSITFFEKTNWSHVCDIPLYKVKIYKKQKTKLEFKPIKKFTNFHEYLWEKNLKNNLDIINTSKYLNWRFVNNPKSKYNMFEILKDKKVIGYLVLKVYLENNKVRTAHICKYVCPSKYLQDIIKFSNNYFCDFKIKFFSLWSPINSKKVIKDLKLTKIPLKNRKFLYRSYKKFNKRKWNLSMSYSDVY